MIVNSLITSHSVFFVCVQSLGFFIYKFISSANRNNFTFSFLTQMSFISYCFCLIIPAGTSSAMLKGNGESGHLFLILDLN
jgi:hypothetical protein